LPTTISSLRETALPPTQEQKAADFRALHEGEPFMIPSPWDAGSARVLEALGFTALATTSSGFAFTLGRLDGNVTLAEMVDHARALDHGGRGARDPRSRRFLVAVLAISGQGLARPLSLYSNDRSH
jgi:phosphoenolpyruvate phosphomutase-like protein